MRRFLEETIESVLAQDYPNLEYIVLDGGSDDGTVELLRRYEGRLRWRSEPDEGAAAALRAGFAEARGEILGWLNADDTLLPGALRAAVEALEAAPDAVAVYGDAWWVDETGARLRLYPTREFSIEALAEECFLCQPACFFRARAYHQAGGIDASYRSAFDYDLWVRLARLGPLLWMRQQWACSRMHPSNKSLGQRGEAFAEGMRVLQRRFGYIPFRWIYSALLYAHDGRDQFFQPSRPSRLMYLKSLPVGLWRNRAHMARYFLDWLRAPNWRAALRRQLEPKPRA
jgi:GT2 family glycosyltransferase